MEARRCAWMSGPGDAPAPVDAVRWWLAISRNRLSRELWRQRCAQRGPARCDRTPGFVSPLTRNR